MLYIAFIKSKPGTVLGNVDIMAKSRKWWNEGDRPGGIKTVGFYGALSSETPDVYVFEAASHALNNIKAVFGINYLTLVILPLT